MLCPQFRNMGMAIPASKRTKPSGHGKDKGFSVEQRLDRPARRESPSPKSWVGPKLSTQAGEQAWESCQQVCGARRAGAHWAGSCRPGGGSDGGRHTCCLPRCS